MTSVICYNAPSIVSLVLAIFLILATFASYIPQIVAIIRAKSSAGLSAVSLATGLVSGLLTLINTGVLNWQRILCCRNNDLPAYQCLGNNLVIQQVAAGPFCIGVVYLFYLIYFDHSDLQDNFKESLKEYKRALALFAVALVLPIILGTIAFILYYGAFLTSIEVFRYAQAIGIISAILVFFQWAPQIYVTWKNGNGGVLSLAMLFLQCPGSFLVVGFQLSAGSDWTSWVPYGVAGCQQVILITILVYFKWRDRNEPSQEELEEPPPSEGTPIWQPAKTKITHE